MNKSSGALRSISGVGRKGPAAFLLETAGLRFLLDLGEGPPPGTVPDVDAIGRVDAVVISHGHRDHVGALALLPKLGEPPVYATEGVARGLPKGIAVRPLPVGGEADVLGIAVATGRNGHAPGGVWLHFAVGDGFLYTGDYCVESVLYAYDPSTRSAAAAVIDCSYADYDKPLAECWSMLAPACGTRAFAVAGTGERPRPGDRAGADAPWRRRDLCRRGDEQGVAKSLRGRCRLAARRRPRRHCASCGYRQADRRAARRHAGRIRRRHLRRHRHA